MKKTKIIGASLSALGLGLAVYFGFIKKFSDGLTGWQKLTKKKEKEEKPVPPVDTPHIRPDTDTSFPISTGAYGNNVRAIQDSLVKNFGQVQIIKDGRYGRKTEMALRQIGYSSPISQDDFNNIIAGKKKAPPVPLFKEGDTVYAKQDMAVFTKPVVQERYRRAIANKFDLLGTYTKQLTGDYARWSKIWVTSTLRTGRIIRDANRSRHETLPGKWVAYVPTILLTKETL